MQNWHERINETDTREKKIKTSNKREREREMDSNNWVHHLRCVCVRYMYIYIREQFTRVSMAKWTFHMLLGATHLFFLDDAKHDYCCYCAQLFVIKWVSFGYGMGYGMSQHSCVNLFSGNFSASSVCLMTSNCIQREWDRERENRKKPLLHGSHSNICSRLYWKTGE